MDLPKVFMALYKGFIIVGIIVLLGGSGYTAGYLNAVYFKLDEIAFKLDKIASKLDEKEKLNFMK
jgi:uncharacterized membrane protein